jgi:hypothetical protein
MINIMVFPNYRGLNTCPKCAAFKDSGMSYVEIAKQLKLPVTTPELSEQSDVARHLVRRGRTLLRELNN